ncbi:MAG TPA: class I SAM-dependent methyltransferase [Bryobacteraceae bacterium]|nr:class I SAM-dependent methyltransferase [Bryobacteraceae bacterium]
MSRCLLCGSPETLSRFRSSDRLYRTTDCFFTVVRCAACGLLRLHPQPSPEELRAYYPPSYWFAPPKGNRQVAAGRLEEAYRRLVLRDHVRFVLDVLRHVEPASCAVPLLDVGCGGGLFLRLMRERGIRGAGLDFSEDASRTAWREQGAPAICGTLDHVPLRAGIFGCVTMFHVLEHLPDPRVFLSAAHRLLVPGGRLVVQVPNAASWQSRLLGHRWNGMDVPRHLFDFRPRDLEKLLKICGFETVRRKFFSLRDNPAGLASSIAPALDPMARRVRARKEHPRTRLALDLAYFGLVVASLPFTIAEAACRAGSTIMIEARKLP